MTFKSFVRYIITWSMAIAQVDQADIDSADMGKVSMYCGEHAESFTLYPDFADMNGEAVCSALFNMKSEGGVFNDYDSVRMAGIIAAYGEQH